MNRDPIDRLLQEHQSIMRDLVKLRDAVNAMESKGDAALPEALPALRGAARLLGGELIAHARREDEALFPALERELGGETGPTAAMRAEHREIQAQAERLRATIHELHEIQHPALARAEAEFKRLATAGNDAESLRVSAKGILSLLDDHFMKEEQVLFPMAREVLAPEALESVALEMDRADMEHPRE
jgi:hemerythrin-like domain-containing protein